LTIWRITAIFIAVERIDYPLTTLYADLVERLGADGALGVPSCGSVVHKQIKGQEYWYHQIRFAGQRVQLYLGNRATPVADWRAHLADRERLCAMLLAGGIAVPERPMGSILEILDAVGVFRAGGVLIGSHAFAIHGNMLGIRWERRLTHTLDVDIGREARVRGASQAKVREQLLKLGFRDIPALDPRHPPVSFMLKDRPVKVDFLTPLKGKAKGEPVALAGMGVHADALRFLDYLIADAVQGALLTRFGVLVTVPQPARFALHKLIVATRRSATEESKRQKDVWQASSLIEVLLEERPHDLRAAWKALPWQKQAREGMRWLTGEQREGLLAEVGG
jgi:hypothetical protein